MTRTLRQAVIATTAILLFGLDRDGLAEFTNVIDVPPVVDLYGLEPDTQVNIYAPASVSSIKAGDYGSPISNVEVNVIGGRASGMYSNGATLNIEGGSVGTGLFFNSNISVDAGWIGNDAYFSNSTIDLTNGSRLGWNAAIHGSTLSLEEGYIGPGLSISSTELNVSGGTLGPLGSNSSDSTVNIRGGIINSLSFTAGSELNIYGTAFSLNGVLVEGQVDLPPESYLIAILEDGNRFMLHSRRNANGSVGDKVPNGVLTLFKTSETPATPDVINAPTDPVPTGLRPGQILNLGAGASVGPNFVAEGAIINISGGTIDKRLELANSELNLFGGDVGPFSAVAGSTINIGGGVAGGIDDWIIGTRDSYAIDSKVNVSGGVVVLTAGDGTVVTATGGLVAGGASSGSVVTLKNSQLGGDYLSSGILSLDSSSTGEYVDAYGCEFTARDSAIGEHFDSYNSVIHLTNTTVDDYFEVRGQSVVTLEGARLGEFAEASDEAVVNFRGGRLGDRMTFEENAQLRIFGDRFKIDGVPAQGTVSLLEGQVLTGTTADGSALLLTSDRRQEFAKDSIRLVAAATPEYSLVPIDLAEGTSPRDLLEGQCLRILQQGELAADFIMTGASLAMDGGSAPAGLDAVRSTIEVNQGTVEGPIRLFDQTNLTVTGGRLTHGVKVYSGSHLTLLGGVVEQVQFSGSGVELFDGVVTLGGGEFLNVIYAYENSVVEVEAGFLRSRVDANDHSSVKQTGGSLSSLYANDYSTVDWTGGSIRTLLMKHRGTLNIFVKEFNIDGVDISSRLQVGSFYEVLERDVHASGILADGTPFGLGLGTTLPYMNGRISKYSVVNVRLVPEPSARTLILGVAILVLVMKWTRAPGRPVASSAS